MGLTVVLKPPKGQTKYE